MWKEVSQFSFLAAQLLWLELMHFITSIRRRGKIEFQFEWDKKESNLKSGTIMIMMQLPLYGTILFSLHWKIKVKDNTRVFFLRDKELHCSQRLFYLSLLSSLIDRSWKKIKSSATLIFCDAFFRHKNSYAFFVLCCHWIKTLHWFCDGSILYAFFASFFFLPRGQRNSFPRTYSRVRTRLTQKRKIFPIDERTSPISEAGGMFYSSIRWRNRFLLCFNNSVLWSLAKKLFYVLSQASMSKYRVCHCLKQMASGRKVWK